MGLALTFTLAFGNELWRHTIVLTGGAEYELARVLPWALSFLRTAAPIAYVIVLAAVLIPRHMLEAAVRPWTLYAALATCNVVFLARAGAAQNYLIEPLVAWLVLGLLASQRLFRDGKIKRASIAAAVTACIFSLNAIAAPYDWKTLRERASRATRTAEQHEHKNRLNLLRFANGSILTNDAALPVTQAQRVDIDPVAHLLLQRAGHWTPEVVVRDCNAGRWKAMILSPREISSLDLQQCLNDHFRRVSKEAYVHHSLEREAQGQPQQRPRIPTTESEQ